VNATRPCRPVLPPRHLGIAALLALAVACGDSTAPSLKVGTFKLKVTTGSSSYTVGGDSAIWVTTGLNLFNAQLVTDSVVPGVPSPFTFFIGLQDSTLAFAALPPGNYHVSPSDSTLPSVALLATGFQALGDSGNVVVTIPRSAQLFEGRVDVWLHDTTTASPTVYHVTGLFSAVPFH
jgi:hypothetical protein